MTKGEKQIEPVKIYRGHSAFVEDVAWHPLHDTIFASAGDDRKMMMFALFIYFLLY